MASVLPGMVQKTSATAQFDMKQLGRSNVFVLLLEAVQMLDGEVQHQYCVDST